MNESRLRDFERKYRRGKTFSVDNETMQSILNDADELIAEIRRLREVLGFYGDNKNWEKQLLMGATHGNYTIDRVTHDQGQRAREAIGE